MLLLMRVLGGLLGATMLIGSAAILLLGSDDLWLRVVYSLAWLASGLVLLRYAVTGRRGAALWSRDRNA